MFIIVDDSQVYPGCFDIVSGFVLINPCVKPEQVVHAMSQRAIPLERPRDLAGMAFLLMRGSFHTHLRYGVARRVCLCVCVLCLCGTSES